MKIARLHHWFLILSFLISCQSKSDSKTQESSILPITNKKSFNPSKTTEQSHKTKDEINYSRLKDRQDEAKAFIKENNLESSFYFLIDLKRHSGLKRFYKWDFVRDTVAKAYMVSHGSGSHSWGKDESKANPEISNIPESYTSSVGKYIIGKKGWSNWGIHINYRLHGKEATNDKAFERNIVLHSWKDVTDKEIYPKGTVEGEGCPAVSNESMKIIDATLQKAKKDVLLWIIY